MPQVATHRYDPQVGACLNLCCLPDSVAISVLDRLRRESRPTLKPNYLIRRRIAERWLWEAGEKALGRKINELPAYFFLGDLAHSKDFSRPAALVLPLSFLPRNAITFTLGDSMSVVEQPNRKVYKLPEIIDLCATSDVIDSFGFSDRHGFQSKFIEVQLWDRACIQAIGL
jgi:hypothetical protein